MDQPPPTQPPVGQPPGAAPPPGQPPGAPWAWPAGHGAAPPSRPGGALVVLGVLNIVFALACGCVTGSWRVMLGGYQELGAEDRARMLDGLWEGLRRSEEEAVSEAGTAEERARIRKAHRRLRRELDRTVEEQIVAATGESPGAGRLRMLGTAGLLLQLGLLVSGVMLLTRARIARTFGILVCAGVLAVNVGTTVSFRDLGERFAAGVQPGLQEIVDDPELMEEIGPEVQEQIRALAEHLRGAVGLAVIVSGVLASLYPLIALLILWLSSGIKRDLGLEPPVVWRI